VCRLAGQKNTGRLTPDETSLIADVCLLVDGGYTTE
jgi:hypothetical protein